MGKRLTALIQRARKLTLKIADGAKPILLAVFIHAGDITFLIAGIICLSIGVFLIYIPAGWITLGLCFIALAFFIGKKQADIEEEKAVRERR